MPMLSPSEIVVAASSAEQMFAANAALATRVLLLISVFGYFSST